MWHYLGTSTGQTEPLGFAVLGELGAKGDSTHEPLPILHSVLCMRPCSVVLALSLLPSPLPMDTNVHVVLWSCSLCFSQAEPGQCLDRRPSRRAYLQ